MKCRAILKRAILVMIIPILLILMIGGNHAVTTHKAIIGDELDSSRNKDHTTENNFNTKYYQETSNYSIAPSLITNNDIQRPKENVGWIKSLTIKYLQLYNMDDFKKVSKINKYASQPDEQKINSTKEYSIDKRIFIKDGVQIKYPQIWGLQDSKKQKYINNMLKTNAMFAFDWYDRKSKGLDLDIDYKIMWNSSNLLSVKYSGSGYANKAVHVNNFMYTVNMDINRGTKVKLNDYMNLNKEFVYKCMNYRDSEESMVNYALEDMISNNDYNILLKYFNHADSTYDYEPAIFSYFTKDSLGLCIEVSDTFGGYVDIRYKYSELKKYLKKDSEVRSITNYMK
ncbi:hypothetical protein [Anaeromicropila herbilytica]|uniref:Deacetylase PdaC domain-containing protein n=1 Tax=Anaeromicropila herbilytica TaxID=2785025 RepID=A0A7R7EJ92_9FIRM|nr:hypothetical protein [Anaeromicropila herbilytica]BCN29447.1 hypothetical protein bsdtb5_07420 [Anaeromicropila herbilytica]